MICPFCDKPAEWVANEAIYGRRYGKSYMMWWCKPCDAYVGCHNNTQQPFGSMANRPMREWRKKTHALLDPIWKSGEVDRREVYRRLSKYLGYSVHVGEASVEDCKRIMEAIPKLFNVDPFAGISFD